MIIEFTCVNVFWRENEKWAISGFLAKTCVVSDNGVLAGKCHVDDH